LEEANGMTTINLVIESAKNVLGLKTPADLIPSFFSAGK
jgi:hypothetical protein